MSSNHYYLCCFAAVKKKRSYSSGNKDFFDQNQAKHTSTTVMHKKGCSKWKALALPNLSLVKYASTGVFFNFWNSFGSLHREIRGTLGCSYNCIQSGNAVVIWTPTKTHVDENYLLYKIFLPYNFRPWFLSIFNEVKSPLSDWEAEKNKM